MKVKNSKLGASVKHKNLVMFLLAAWAMCFAHVIRASTIEEFMGPYDPALLKWAALVALLGGVFRTIFSLQSDARVIRQIAPEAAWDACKALAAGLLVFWAIQALRSYGWAIPSEVRFGAVLVAGILRFTAVFWLRDAGREWLNARKAQFINRPINEPKDAP
jgi:hypothetical protein